MNKVQHPSNNGVLGAPVGWDQEELPCDALPITRTYWNGVLTCVSFWKLTEEELAALNAGRVIRLWVAGATMPPVMLDIDDI